VRACAMAWAPSTLISLSHKFKFTSWLRLFKNFPIALAPRQNTTLKSMDLSCNKFGPVSITILR
jgi:hypothetical protein